MPNGAKAAKGEGLSQKGVSEAMLLDASFCRLLTAIV